MPAPGPDHRSQSGEECNAGVQDSHLLGQDLPGVCGQQGQGGAGEARDRGWGSRKGEQRWKCAKQNSQFFRLVSMRKASMMPLTTAPSTPWLGTPSRGASGTFSSAAWWPLSCWESSNSPRFSSTVDPIQGMLSCRSVQRFPILWKSQMLMMMQKSTSANMALSPWEVLHFQITKSHCGNVMLEVGQGVVLAVYNHWFSSRATLIIIMTIIIIVVIWLWRICMVLTICLIKATAILIDIFAG